MVLTEGQKQAIEKLDAEMEKAKDSCSKSCWSIWTKCRMASVAPVYAKRWLVPWRRAKTRLPSAWQNLSRRFSYGDYAY